MAAKPGLHPSNIHDNAYAIGTVDFTGDMPVILGPDGPSLGGFVCPATIVQAELWKMGQLKPGDLMRFRAISRAGRRRAMEERDGSRRLPTLAGNLPALARRGRARRAGSVAARGDGERGRPRLSAGPMATGIC